MSIATFIEQTRPPLKVREDGSQHGERVFEIRSSDDTTTMADILAHGSCPAKGSSHPDNSAALVRTLEADPVDGFHDLHLLTCNYDTKSSDQDDEDDPDNALVKAGFRAQDVAKPAFVDAFGRPNVNTAGDLIPGLQRFANQWLMTVTMKLTTIPLYLFALNNTLNNANYVVRGITFPPGTLTLKNLNIPDEPETSPDGTEYWPITFEIVHDPDGFYELHPNKGKHELVYQTRTGASAAWTDDTYSNYSSKSPTTDRRIIKRRILTDEDQAAGGDIWLDSLGRAVRNPPITTAALGQTGTMLSGDHTLTLSGAFFDTSADDEHQGASIAIVGAGPHGRTLVTRVSSVTSTTVAELDDAAATVVSGATVYLPGIIVLRIINQPLADWSSLPVANNDPA